MFAEVVQTRLYPFPQARLMGLADGNMPVNNRLNSYHLPLKRIIMRVYRIEVYPLPLAKNVTPPINERNDILCSFSQIESSMIWFVKRVFKVHFQEASSLPFSKGPSDGSSR